jgi:hypothetical protein
MHSAPWGSPFVDGRHSLASSGENGKTDEMLIVTQFKQFPDDATGLAHDLVTTEITYLPDYVGAGQHDPPEFCQHSVSGPQANL